MKEILVRLNEVLNSVSEPFWLKADFWIGIVFNALGLWLSWLAYKEAKKAKEAAEKAVRTVRMRALVLDLTEIVQGFDRLDATIQYIPCRTIVNETTRKINRLLGPLKADTELTDPALIKNINDVETTLENLRSSLESVTPFGDENQGSPHAIYRAVEGTFSLLSSQLSLLIGSIESKTIILPN